MAWLSQFTDVGGIAPMRQLWPEYLREGKIDVLAFVVDASNEETFPLAQQELQRCLQPLAPTIPTIVLATKFDVHRACSAYQLCKVIFYVLFCFIFLL